MKYKRVKKMGTEIIRKADEKIAEYENRWLPVGAGTVAEELRQLRNTLVEQTTAAFGQAQRAQQLEDRLAGERSSVRWYSEQKQILSTELQKYKTKEAEFTTLDAQLKDLPNAIKARETNLENKNELYTVREKDLATLQTEYNSKCAKIILPGLSQSEEELLSDRLLYLDDRKSGLEKELRDIHVDLLDEQRKLDWLLDYKCDLESQKSDKTPQYAAIDSAAAKARENKAANEERAELVKDRDKRAKRLLETIKQKGNTQTQTNDQQQYVKPTS